MLGMTEGDKEKDIHTLEHLRPPEEAGAWAGCLRS